MPISRRRSGIDITSLTPFNKDITGVVGTGAFQPIMSITGRGKLNSFYASQASGVAGFSLKITVDGISKIILGTSSTFIVGLANKNDIIPSASAGSSAIRTPAAMSSSNHSSFKSYPITDNSNGIVLLDGDDAIYFNSSLLLEISCGATGNYAYHYAGGYQ